MLSQRRRLTTPRNLWSLIETQVGLEPHRLSMHHYHELSGKEALTWHQITDLKCRHCLVGWVIAMTPGAVDAEVEEKRDPVWLANHILVTNGMLPIPSGIVFSDNKSALKFIRGRAAEERQVAYATN